ncbi:hypothetical protein E2562_017287 [Oryza meyeriana var. granulata]|uniref:Uncharacterized protein n=1 Tax=Oryza meyeriana var. granulata TaxID=110450 RepID=A0A6G1EM77_9ORYZ|nr:hypothetical protein E2562_017287 [Oryza meyeriana var. granulata]
MDGCTTNLTEATRMVQHLKVNGFSATKAMDQEYYKSSWSVDGYKWGISCTGANLLRQPQPRRDTAAGCTGACLSH